MIAADQVSDWCIGYYPAMVLPRVLLARLLVSWHVTRCAGSAAISGLLRKLNYEEKHGDYLSAGQSPGNLAAELVS